VRWRYRRLVTTISEGVFQNACSVGHLGSGVMKDEYPDDMDLDLPMEPVEYPPELRTVRELLERAIRLSGADPSDVLSDG
jgi:hypothetical protein